MSEILPTHTCFDDALDFISWRLGVDARDVDVLVLVHAICLAPDGPKKGSPFAHAWVEELVSPSLTVAWQTGLMEGHRIHYSCDAAELELELQVQDVTRYSMREVNEENRRTMSYGPWLEKYKALCGKGEVFR